MKMRLPLLASVAAFAQRAAEFETRPATAFENDKLELLVLNKGGAFASLILKDDSEKLNPMWNPAALARMTKGPSRFGDSIGHFVCVDGFGPTSKEEAAAGLQGHGEAHRQPWEIVEKGRNGNTQFISWRARLPVVQEIFTRKLEVVDGEQVVYVESSLENELAFDRPINWAEHGTIGYPFLAPGKTVIDASVGRCQTRPHQNVPPNRRLVSEKEFQYPVAPLKAGGSADLRQIPNPPDSMDHTGCLLDPSRRLGFITAINLEKRMMLGYLVRREEYPWLQEWMNYPPNMALSRGLEFGTQPFDVSRRTTVEMGKLFDVPAFRWLPAKSKIGTRFLMFYTRVPAGFTKVDDVRQENGELVIEDKASRQTIRLKASLPL
ncbi:MAG: hypothetical protein FJW30_07945 [Acidobacteria bacterium]|nr:hypothetical protein [Acidobacteriota bacterium]